MTTFISKIFPSKAVSTPSSLVRLSDKVPIWKVEEHLLLSKTQALSTVLELTMPPAYSLSGEKLVEVYELFNRIVKAIPKGYLLHKQDYYHPKRYYRSTDGRTDGRTDSHAGSNTFLQHGYETKFHERLFYNHHAFLIISKAPNGDQFVPNFLNSFVTGRFVQRDISEGLVEFENTVRKVLHILASGNIAVRLLRNGGVTDLINGYFNLGKSRILRDIQIKNDHLQICGDDVVLYSSVGAEIELPKEFDIHNNIDEFFDRSFTFPLGIGFNAPHIVNTVIRKNDPNALIKLLGKTREKILSMSLKSRQNAQLVDEYDHFLSDVIKTGETPVYVTQNVILWGKDTELHLAENELNNALAKMDVYTQRNFNCANLFWACCPGNAYEIPKSEFQIQLSDAACMLFPIETNPKNNGINGIKLSERDFGIPITIDNWTAPMKKGLITNRNMFILGPSGSGKSFFTNHLVRQLIEQGYHITIIDVGGSYKRLCQHKGGRYFEYTANSKMAFNPFYVPTKKGKYIIKNLEEQESLKTLIFTLWKGEQQEISKEEYTILSKCLKYYYDWIQQVHQDDIDKNRDVIRVPSFNSFFEYVRDHFQQKLKESELKYFDFVSFKMVLEPYYQGGEYDYLLNNPEEFSIADLPFCVFELDEIKDHKVIFPVVALVIMDAFISKMRRHKSVRKMILIEEAWSAISNHGMANFLRYLYKTVRKFNGAVGVITQEIEDIINNPFVQKTILNNADIQILLDQTKYQTRFSELAAILGLPASETKKVLSMNKIMRSGERYKDVYIRFGTFGIVYSVLVSAFEAAMYTTEASESEEINRYIDQQGSIQYGILRYLEDKGMMPEDYFTPTKATLEA